MTKSVDDFQIQFDIVYPQTSSPSSLFPISLFVVSYCSLSLLNIHWE